MAQNIDIGFVLDRIRPRAKYRMYGTYADLKRTWEDETQTLPTWGEIRAEWNVASGVLAQINADRELAQSENLREIVKDLVLRVEALEAL